MQQVLVYQHELNTLLEKVSLLEKEVAALKGIKHADTCKMPEARNILQISSREVLKLVAKGKIKYAVQQGIRGDWFFKRSELIELSESIFQS